MRQHDSTTGFLGLPLLKRTGSFWRSYSDYTGTRAMRKRDKPGPESDPLPVRPKTPTQNSGGEAVAITPEKRA